MAKEFVLAFDQGTTSSRSLLFDGEGQVIATAQEEFEQIFPQPGWVEHDPEAIWRTQLSTGLRVLEKAKVGPESVAAIGVTNQRETTVLWERSTGRPVYNAIVWQCRRSAPLCEELRSEGLNEEFQSRTGLVLDAYFSGTKVCWILDNVPGARARAERGELCFGTIDSWLLYQMTGIHATDYSNASRTLLYNIHELAWDDMILERLRIPRSLLPEVRATSGVFGATTALGGEIPVAALCGDQQSALFGQTAFKSGECKNTYGTGCFLLMNTGAEPIGSKHGLLTTIAWGLEGKVTYALEGSVFIGGAVVQWLRDGLGLISTAAESEGVAAQTETTEGVYIVPAFVGLGAPHWDMRARGIITGLTRGSGRPQIVRAALESISFQSAELLACMEKDAGLHIPALKVDGGAASNDLLMQHQADVLGIPVARGEVLETTALGAAFLAGLAVGFWRDQDSLAQTWRCAREFRPVWDKGMRDMATAGWVAAVRQAKEGGRS